MTLKMLRLLLLVFLPTTLAKISVRNVTIPKCCELDEHMSEETGYVCKPGKQTNWTPTIYSPKSKNYLNYVPPNWIIKPLKPECSANSTYYPYPGRYIMFERGYLRLLDYPDENKSLLKPNQYCIDHKTALVCSNDVPPVIRIRKCCYEGYMYGGIKRPCISTNGSDYKIDVKKFNFVYGFPQCAEMVVAGKLQDAQLQDNGSLFLTATELLIPESSFCLDYVLDDPGRSASIFTCHHLVPSSVIPTTSENSKSDLRFTLYPIGLALSAIFLAATLAAGCFLPASHHVLHWRCQTNHVACLLVGDVLLCITQAAGKISPAPCFAIAVAMHFLFLAAFFWLNTMCFNIWWTFRDLRPQSLEKSQERCRLRLYEIYAWGGPLLIAGTAAILDSLPDNPDYPFLRPRFGANTCWFYGDLEILTYFFGPVGALLVINLALFAATARELTCGLWKRELVKSTTERAALGRVCLKLVIVMGITWIADVLSWAVGGPQELWYVTDLINCLQGVFIFIVVGCQPQVLTAVKRWWCWRKHHTTGTAGTTNHHSSSSQGLPSMGDTITNHSVTNNTKSVPLETSC